MWVTEWNEVVFTNESRQSVCNTTMVGFEPETPWRKDAEQLRAIHHHTGPAPGNMVWGSFVDITLALPVRIAGTLKQPSLHLRGVGASCPFLAFRA
ncbi:hypothetical protein TNCV_1618321 [Trichonephila clavipes]|nr:hypothetical protein TNCV_1618321 [Trichonephila clavipes]